MDKTSLGDRMKNNYENVNRFYLTRRMPVIIRMDMKAGHTFTRGMKKPFDDIFVKTMQNTMKYLCENIQGCVIGYTQSDEISLVLTDYAELTTDAWFGNNLQKMCSVSASMATLAFNKAFRKNVNDWWFTPFSGITKEFQERVTLYKTYKNAIEKGAMFDCRCFNIPKEEVTNLVYWRQLDASRNSIQMVGQANFSHKELQNKSCNDIQDMLMTQKGINWNDLPTYQKRGSCCVRNKIVIESDGVMVTAQLRDTSKSENEWIIDTDIPIFKGEGREYVDRLVFIGEE